MKLTTGAVECLSRGAAHDDPDVNAVGPNGDLFEAGQIVAYPNLRRMVDLGVRSGDRAIRRTAIRQTARPPAISFQKRIPENESNNQQRELFSWHKSPVPG